MLLGRPPKPQRLPRDCTRLPKPCSRRCRLAFRTQSLRLKLGSLKIPSLFLAVWGGGGAAVLLEQMRSVFVEVLASWA